MNVMAKSISAPNSVHRIGILFSDAEELRIPALRFLILKLNSLQRAFEYEILPNRMPDSPLEVLSDRTGLINRMPIRDIKAPEFAAKYDGWLRSRNEEFGLQEEPPKNFLFISMASFDDLFYSTRPGFELTAPYRISILALGNWKANMAPPSLAEFILTLTIRESIAFVCPALAGSIHLGTKGCICDFTESLNEVRFKILHGFVCNFCQGRLADVGLPGLGADVARILGKEWLGKRSNPGSVAGILASLDYDLFVTKAPDPTTWDKLRTKLQEEGTKQVIDLVGKLVLAFILFYLSFHGIKVKAE